MKKKTITLNFVVIFSMIVLIGIILTAIVLKMNKMPEESTVLTYQAKEEKATTTTSSTVVETWDISATENDSVTATLYEDGKLAITGTGNMKDWSSSSDVSWKDKRSQITSVEIADGVTSIGSSAFYLCDNLTNISIPKRITSIGLSAFSGCSRLTKIGVNRENSTYSSEEGILFNKDKTEIIKYPEGKRDVTEYIIPTSVRKIENAAFLGCRNLTRIEIPEGITRIEDYTFHTCSGLTNIEIPEGVTSIGKQAFYECKNLTSIKIRKGVMSIGTYQFYGCNNLTIYCEEDSYAKEYAIDNNIPYNIINEGGNNNQGGNGNEGSNNKEEDKTQDGVNNQGGDKIQNGGTSQSGTTSQKVSTSKDKTSSNPQTVTSASSPKELPKTGTSIAWMVVTIIVSIIGMISYIQYRRMHNI